LERTGKKLTHGLRVLLYRPEWARTCDDCARWLFDSDGEIVRRPARIGLPVLRPPISRTPCERCPKIPDDAPAKMRRYAIELSDQNYAAYNFYRECLAVGDFPRDPIVRRWAGLIRRVEDRYGRGILGGKLDMIIQLLSLGAVRGG
jgi:hypothetical protein